MRIMLRRTVVLAVVAAMCTAAFAAKPRTPLVIDASEAGAVADGKTLNTAVLQNAIDKISSAGGGTLVLKGGSFLTGNLFLKDNVELRVEAGATLLGSTNPFDYTLVTDTSIPEGRGLDSARMGLIIIHKVKNVKLSGYGTIDGQGRALAVAVDSINTYNKKHGAEKRERPGEISRQKLLFGSDSDGITIENLNMRNSAVWGISFDGCENVRVEGIKVYNRAYWNNDGIDLTDSRHVVIRNCDINSADDGICFKSNRDDYVNTDILIENCSIASSASAIKFGTASYGIWKGVAIRNIKVRDTFRSAIAIESVDGARIEDILVENVYARNTGNGIFLRLGRRRGDGGGCLRNVTIRNLSCEVPAGRPDQGYDIPGPIVDYPHHNPYPCSITGLPANHVENVLIENVELILPGRATKAMGYVPLTDLDLVPENEAEYPEYSMFGELPAYAFYVRHADGVKFRNIRIFLMEDDYRPAIVADDAPGISFQKISLPLGKDKGQIFLRGCTLADGSEPIE